MPSLAGVVGLVSVVTRIEVLGQQERGRRLTTKDGLPSFIDGRRGVFLENAFGMEALVFVLNHTVFEERRCASCLLEQAFPSMGRTCNLTIGRLWCPIKQGGVYSPERVEIQA